MVWRYGSRRKKAQVNPLRGTGAIEGAWALTVTVLFAGLAVTGFHTWSRVHYAGVLPGALRIEVWGEQFQWYFRYPGPDGHFGPVHFDLMRDSTGNYLGLAPQIDPASRDDIITAVLGVPVNRPIELILRSKDMIHSFFVPKLRLKQDMVPGMEIPIYFTATRTGRYEIVCAQLCGIGHYNMHADLLVMAEAKFKAWLQKMAAEQ